MRAAPGNGSPASVGSFASSFDGGGGPAEPVLAIATELAGDEDPSGMELVSFKMSQYDPSSFRPDGDLNGHNVVYSGKIIRVSSRTVKDEAPPGAVEDFLGVGGHSPHKLQLRDVLAKFNQLRLVVYRYKSGTGVGTSDCDWHLGFMAEEVEEVSRTRLMIKYDSYIHKN